MSEMPKNEDEQTILLVAQAIAEADGETWQDIVDNGSLIGTTAYEYIMFARAAIKAYNATECDRLREAIDEAPHDEFECDWVRAFRRWQSGPQDKHDAPKEDVHCTCWKREVITPRN